MKDKQSKVNPYKKDFPLLINRKIAYLDNAATAQRPACVINAVKEFYENYNANPLRGLYELAIDATESYENSREVVKEFINAKSTKEIIFTRNTTEGLNLVAYSYALNNLKKGDEILITIMEHHSNMLPWQMAAKKTGAVLKYLECNKDGSISDESIERAISQKTKIVAMAYVSNVFGRVNPIEKVIKLAHKNGSIVVVDAAQAAPHIPIDVQKLDADFLAFSGHKLMSPLGIGVLFGKEELLDKMSPFMTGGEMIESVSRYDAKYAELPHKFEAGTVNAAGAVGLAEAIKYLKSIGFSEIKEREDSLTKAALDKIKDIPGINVIGSENPKDHSGIITFTVDGVHPHDVASILDADGVNIRAGHHCAQPLMNYLDIGSSVRASIAFYNDEEDINKFIDSLKNVRRRMGYEQ